MTYSPRYQLLALTLTLTVVMLSALRSPTHLYVVGISYLVALLVSIWFVTRTRTHLVILSVLGLATLFLNAFFPVQAPSALLSAIDDGVGVAFTGYIGALIVHHLARTSRVTGQELLGVYSLYLLAGVVFAQTYEILLFFDPRAILLDPVRFSVNMPGSAELIYYSFMTLATVGLGDATPGNPVARAVTVVESIFGVIFLATVMGRYVALHVEHSREEQQEDRD